ncbi:MAG: type I-U CRISPR-associated protein Cas5/Cas6 [Planctomycetes bacterium]|nr:type I-U CRISPR-associated protein Cas5/Cas6 [Planctomycetota bacterium]
MQIIAIEFTARRYHATPWDAHVNEGRIEWPPCPWRLLRALIAVGYNKCGWIDGPPDTAASLFKNLAACVPEFSLPKATDAHTRHYMPSREGSKEKSVKVFDTFLRFSDPDDRLLVRFDVRLEADQGEELEQLVRGLAYLGRAESWVDAELLGKDEANDVATNREWHGVAGSHSRQRVRLLAPLHDDTYHQWRTESVSQAANEAEAVVLAAAEAKGKNLTPAAKKKARASAERPYPADLMAAFQQDTSKWQSEGWPRPPGSRWVDYELPPDAFDRKPLTTLARSPHFTKPQAILLSIDGEGKRGTLRPRMRRALPLMELLHSEAIRHADQLELGHLPELTGTNSDGTPLRGDHSHAHWLPLSFKNDDAIDHVLVYSPGRLSQASVEAISAIRWAYAKGIRALSVNMVGQGTIAELSQQLGSSGQVDIAALRVFETSAVWESATPLVLRKYLHRRGKKTVEGQIREELLERGYPEPIQIEIWQPQTLVERKLKGFVLRRKPGKQQPPCERSWGVTIHFAEPVSSHPISLGYASHFGLGLFRAGD